MELLGELLAGSPRTAGDEFRLVGPIAVWGDEGAHDRWMRHAQSSALLTFDEFVLSEEGHREADFVLVDAVVAG
ncbi:hypothetical protein [Streptomyces inhibens]|uniref:hypothetical protein n=1 Tax=Streptomyces inhibens TaxID=2293571 RepID=UPI001EE693E6|nr:hypothetical protein [Streptomyces inhibens]